MQEFRAGSDANRSTTLFEKTKRFIVGRNACFRARRNTWNDKVRCNDYFRCFSSYSLFAFFLCLDLSERCTFWCQAKVWQLLCADNNSKAILANKNNKTKQNNKEIPILWCVGITTCFFCYCYYFIIILFPYYRTGLLSKHANASKQKAIYILSSFQSFLSSLCLTWIGKCTAQREYYHSLVLEKHKRNPPGSVVHCTSSFNR